MNMTRVFLEVYQHDDQARKTILRKEFTSGINITVGDHIMLPIRAVAPVTSKGVDLESGLVILRAQITFGTGSAFDVGIDALCRQGWGKD
jgi:hypothetical protein